MSSIVASVACADYEPRYVEASVRKAVELSGYEVPRGRSVLIKPNILSQNRPEQHSITHPAVVEALCRLFLDSGCRVTIGESISFWQRGLTRKAFATSGAADISRRLGVALAPFDEEELVEVTRGLRAGGRLYLPRIALDAEVIVDACKLKSHGGLRLSGAVKNLFGFLPGGYKQLLHMRTENDFELSDVFLDLLRILRPALSVMDAVVGLDGGPSAIGRPRMVGAILASTNPAALDAAACRIIGYGPREVATLVRAEDRGMVRLDSVSVRGELPSVPFRSLRRGPIPLHPRRDGPLVRCTSALPAIRRRRCDGCGACAVSCAPRAISTGEGGLPEIDPELCIRCYLCASRCPRGAVALKRGLLARLIGLGRRILGI